MEWLINLIAKEARRHTRRRDVLLISFMFAHDGTMFSTSRWVFFSEMQPLEALTSQERLGLYWATMCFGLKKAVYLHEWEIRAGKEGVW